MDSWGVFSAAVRGLKRVPPTAWSRVKAPCSASSAGDTSAERLLAVLDYGEKLTAKQVIQVEYDPEPWKAEYERWAESHGVTGGITATTGDIPNVFRFVFDIAADKNLADLEEPLLKIEFVDGKPVLRTPEIVAEGVVIAVIASSDLANWSESSRVGMDYDPVSRHWMPQGAPPQVLYFRLSADID